MPHATAWNPCQARHPKWFRGSKITFNWKWAILYLEMRQSCKWALNWQHNKHTKSAHSNIMETSKLHPDMLTNTQIATLNQSTSYLPSELTSKSNVRVQGGVWPGVVRQPVDDSTVVHDYTQITKIPISFQWPSLVSQAPRGVPCP